MCLTAYIWTKSRFLGLSLGVHHIGKGQTIFCHPLPPHTLTLFHPHTTVHLNLLDYGEEYTVTLPNAYARYFVALIHQTSPTPLPFCLFSASLLSSSFLPPSSLPRSSLPPSSLPPSSLPPSSLPPPFFLPSSLPPLLSSSLLSASLLSSSLLSSSSSLPPSSLPPPLFLPSSLPPSSLPPSPLPPLHFLSLRSILTYPWMEMGGKCHLECAQTGYYADIDFHCKVQIYCW